MILADTSIWVDHFRTGDDELAHQLEAGSILIHPFVIGELALGHLRDRTRIIEGLKELPAATVASNEEVLRFINSAKLFGRGIGYVDAHLIATTRLSQATLWTRDRILRAAATDLGLVHTAS